MPFAGIGVDVIVGFPGETEEDFLTTYNFLNDLPVSYLHVVTYSERPNTEAILRKEVVPAETRAERSKMLRSLSEKKKRYFYEQNIGRQASVLFENDIVDGRMHGFTENYIRVTADYDPVKINEIVPVTLASVNANNLAEVKETAETLVS